MSDTTETRPRRTLADVVANPPEGWRGMMRTDGHARFDHAGATVWTGSPADWPEATIDRDLSFAVMASRARAVADLLDLLAKVSDV